MHQLTGNPWKNERYFSSYEEASSLKKALLLGDSSGTLQVKVKRCGAGGTLYVVKSRLVVADDSPKEKQKTNSKKTKK